MATKPIPGGGNFERRDPVPAGLHVARCVALYEIGTIEDSWQGQVKHLFKINVGFELPNVLMDFEEKQGDGQTVTVKKPAMVSQMFTLSAAENSRLRKFMESWRGAKYKDGEFENVDLSKMLGQPCMLNIIHTVKSDVTYANIDNVMPVYQGIQVPPQFNASRYLSYDNWNQQLFESLPKFIRELVQKTPEYNKLGSRNQGGYDGFAAKPATPVQQQPVYQAPQQAMPQQSYAQPQANQQFQHNAPPPPQVGQWPTATGGSDISGHDGLPF